MRNFEIFYFDNDMGEYNEFNPRFVMGQPYIKEIISILGHNKPFSFSLKDLAIKLKINNDNLKKSINLLKNISAIRVKKEKLSLAFPFFTSGDCKIIKKIVLKELEKIEKLFKNKIVVFRKKIGELYPDIDQNISLYHLLCGKFFDGSMFDFLEKQNLLAKSFPKKDNRDYIIIGYNLDRYCKKFNSELFCSFNHARYGKSSLSSFGNAEGNRFDYFRYFKLREKQQLSKKFLKVDKDLKIYSSDEIVKRSLCVLDSLYYKKPFEKDLFYFSLKRFNYINRDDQIIVPVFYNHIEKCAEFSEFAIKEIGKIIIQNMQEVKKEVLKSDISCINHTVPIDELCNELWHIYFGLLNKFLIDKKYVAHPKHFLGEGKYLKCVYI